MKDALRPLRRMYEVLPVAEFGPLKLKAVRQSMIDDRSRMVPTRQRYQHPTTAHDGQDPASPPHGTAQLV